MAARVRQPVDSVERIRTGYFVLLLILVAQFLLGMAVNLVITISSNHPGANAPEYFGGVAASVTWAILHGPVLLQAHAALGLLPVLFSVNSLAQAIQVRTRRVVLPVSWGVAESSVRALTAAAS